MQGILRRVARGTVSSAAMDVLIGTLREFKALCVGDFLWIFWKTSRSAVKVSHEALIPRDQAVSNSLPMPTWVPLRAVFTAHLCVLVPLA